MSYGNGLALVAGMGNLAGPLPISVGIDSVRQKVGQVPVYSVIGAPPNKGVLWSSFFNGAETGEKAAYYGHNIEANGTAQIKGDPWKEEHIGRWIKIVEVQGDDGKAYQGIVEFIVEPGVVTQPAAPIYAPQSSGSFLEQELFQLGNYSVTPGILLGVGVGLYALKAFKIIK